MAILVRRSNLLVPVVDARMPEAWRHNADAITLDLEGISDTQNLALRSLLKDAIAPMSEGGAEVFVRVRAACWRADLEACVGPGLRGIVLPHVDSAERIVEAASVVTTLESERGLAGSPLSFVVLLESARAILDIRSIIRASPRISQVGLDERALAASLDIDIDPEHDPFVYARGRLAIEATAARVAAIGMAYPLSVKPRELPPSEILSMATKAKNLGMKGVLCPYPSWVEPVNAAFTPTTEQIAWNKRVREAFAAGVAAGTAAVPLDGKMIDVPVDEWAKVVIATAEACAARDAEKRLALTRRHAPG